MKPHNIWFHPISLMTSRYLGYSVYCPTNPPYHGSLPSGCLMYITYYALWDDDSNNAYEDNLDQRHGSPICYRHYL